MAFNKGYELKKFEAHWEKLRIEYAEAGMADDAIQKMYDYDRQQFNSERTCIERTQEFTAPAYESSEEEASPLMLRYQEAITTTDTYHETKSSFAWIGEIEDEHLLAALEQLSDSDLELITLYAYEEYDTVEISKLFGTTKQNISKKIRRITNFIFTIDKSRVQNFVGHLTPEEMSRVDDAVKISLALNPMGSIQKLKPIIRSAAAYAPPEVVDGKPPVYPYTPIKSDFEDAETVEEMMLYTELQSAVHAMIQRLEYSFTFNPSLLTSPKRKKQVAEILTEAEKYIWRIKEEMRCA